MFRRVGSNQRMVELLGWEPEHDIDAGLRTVIDYVAATRVKVLVTGALGLRRAAPDPRTRRARRRGRRHGARRRPHPTGRGHPAARRSIWPRRSTTVAAAAVDAIVHLAQANVPVPRAARSSSTASTRSRRSGCSTPARAPARVVSCTPPPARSTASATRPFRESDPVRHHQLYATTKIHAEDLVARYADLLDGAVSLRLLRALRARSGQPHGAGHHRPRARRPDRVARGGRPAAHESDLRRRRRRRDPRRARGRRPPDRERGRRRGRDDPPDRRGRRPRRRRRAGVRGRGRRVPRAT